MEHKLLIFYITFEIRVTVTDIKKPGDPQIERKTVQIDAAQTEIFWLLVPGININIKLEQNVCMYLVTTLLAVKRLNLLYSTLQFSCAYFA